MNEEYERDLLFSFNVKYTKKEYLNLSRFQIYVLYRYLHIVIYALDFFMLSVYLYINNAFYIQSILCMLFIALYTAFVYFLPNIITYLTYSKRQNIHKVGIMVNFEVYDDYFNVYTSEGSVKQKCKYSSLYKIYETKSHFYLYLNKNLAYIIPKKRLMGSINNFRGILLKNALRKCVKVY